MYDHQRLRELHDSSPVALRDRMTRRQIPRHTTIGSGCVTG
jgi:hypothetical protein